MRIYNVKIEDLLSILKKYKAEKIIYVDVETSEEDNRIKLIPIATRENIEDTDEDLDDLIA